MSAPGVEDLRAAGFPGVRQLIAAAVGVEGALDVWPVEVGGHLTVYARIVCPCTSEDCYTVPCMQDFKQHPTDLSAKLERCW